MDRLSYDLINNNKYIHKSQINKKTLKKLNLSRFTVKEVKHAFDECDYVVGIVGNPYMESQQKHIKYVDKYILYHKVVKGR